MMTNIKTCLLLTIIGIIIFIFLKKEAFMQALLIISAACFVGLYCFLNAIDTNEPRLVIMSGGQHINEAETHIIKVNNVTELNSNFSSECCICIDSVDPIDSYKLAEHISKFSNQLKLNPKLFIQINIGNEPQKNGIKISDVNDFVNECKNKLSLNFVGLMCLPPVDKNPEQYFLEMQNIKNRLNFNHLSMGMTNDYLSAIKFGATFLRIGTKIFGERK